MAYERIAQNRKVMMEKPVIRGTRITVEIILRLLGQGWSIEAVLNAYPGLTREDVLAAQAFAADSLESIRTAAAE